MSFEELNSIAGFMKSFSNPVRLDLIYTLQEQDGMTVNELVERLGAKQCHVSQQLGYLARKGVLERRRVGHNVFYSLKMRHVVDMLDMVQMELKKEDGLAVAK